MTVKAHWHNCTNFGDALTPYLIKKISGQDVEYVEVNSEPPPFMVTGSILGCNTFCGIVWGAGCAFESDLNPDLFNFPFLDYQIIATRGLLSKELVEQSGHKPIAYGDPGFLLPRFYHPDMEVKYDVGIICSWVDFNYVDGYFKNDRVTVINALGSYNVVEETVDKLLQCRVIVSSTLHGLVAAIAYGIPAVLVKFSNKMIGDGFKFRDVLTCTDQQYEPIDLSNIILDADELTKLTFLHKITVDLDKLFDCCPFKDLPPIMAGN